MSLRLVIEHSPHRQPVSELSHPGGELSIGRGAEADWRLEDPDMFISRKHCLVAGDGDGFTVTDVSRGGLFLDGSDAPLGAGRSCRVQDGMRMRLGDVVIRAELRADAALPPSGGRGREETARSAFAADDFFAQRPVAEVQEPRPASLPDPFGAPRDRVRGAPPPPRSAPPAFDDAFTLDPLPSSGEVRPATPTGAAAARSAASPEEPGGAFRAPDPRWPDPGERSVPVASAARGPVPPDARLPQGSPALAEAFLRGLGLDPSKAAGLGPTEMEVLGRRFRALVEVLEQSLRSRARDKRNLRVAQTVIGSADVNPLKFLPTPEAMVEAMIGPPRPGYLDADAAIASAGRDLADHQLRSWSGLQAALRRMIARFDPEEVERELEAAGRLRAILAGGRSALLWQLYRERYKAIAKAAEDRFLGEVGNDFRDAYEGQGRMDHD